MSAINSELAISDYKNYILDSNLQIKDMRHGGRFNQSVILTYSDDREWVFLKDKPEERFCGFLYLQNALALKGSDKIEAAVNKMALHDKKIIYLSEYCGEKKLEAWDFVTYKKERSILAEVGFKDTAGGANLRIKNDKLYVFDTEKHSFDAQVHKEIDSYANFHNLIRSNLEETI